MKKWKRIVTLLMIVVGIGALVQSSKEVFAAENTNPPVVVKELRGWVQEGQDWKYYKNQKAVTGWLNTGNVWYYFNKNGIMQTGWQKIAGVWYHFNNKGYMKTGWLKTGGVWYFFNKNGNMKTGWEKIAGVWYYFNNNGYMKTGWLKTGGVWYYFNNNGNMKTGWQKIAGVWYFFNKNGAMQTNWLKTGNTWYYFNSNGNMKTGWLKLGNTWYYFNGNGSMKTGWLKTGGHWYYFTGSGPMVTGYQVIDGTTYYFRSNGVMLENYVPERPGNNKPTIATSKEERLIMQREFDRLLNEYRGENGLPPVQQIAGANWIAEYRADEISQVFEHAHPDGSSIVDMVPKAVEKGKLPPYSFTLRNENIAASSSVNNLSGKEAAKQVFNLWRNSPGHNANLLGEYDVYGFSNGTKTTRTGKNTLQNGKPLGYEYLGIQSFCFNGLSKI